MKATIILGCLLTSLSLYCQNIEPIEADRPDQTETPSIVPKGMFQVESGFSYQKNTLNRSSWMVPSILWKYGVNSNLELRVITEIEQNNNGEESEWGLHPLMIGLKVKLLEENGIVPKTSIIAHLGLPNVASENLKATTLKPEFRFTMQHSLTEKLSLGYNLGAEWDEISDKPTYIYTLTTGIVLIGKLNSYLELYGFSAQNQTAAHNLAGGMVYLITDNFMVDLSSGIGVLESDLKHYIAIGFSFRI